MEPNSLDYEKQLKQLKKENRILTKKLQRSQERQIQLEETNQKKESVLKKVILGLEESRDVSEQRTTELSATLAKLKTTQEQLIESEKMAALGNLVAGVAHEINTPVGNSVTAASTLAEETTFFTTSVSTGLLKRSTLNNYLDLATEASEIILSNLQRAGELIQSFKQVAVDRTSLERRTFPLKSYLSEILVTLEPQLKKTPHQVTVTGDDTIQINSYPGAFAQIVTNFITNSIVHAYPTNKPGSIQLDIHQQSQQIVIKYQDDGCGIEEQYLNNIFEPFFTTNRDQGGSGLGMHIVYNLVTQKLKGTIKVTSQVNLSLIHISEPTRPY